MYVIVWEFIIREGCATEFEATYGPRGEWSKLFSRAPGYRGTQLLHDLTNRLRYVTLDFWDSREAHANFRTEHESEYGALDGRCEWLTVRETRIGEFEE